jgi:hypothetical protein
MCIARGGGYPHHVMIHYLHAPCILTLGMISHSVQLKYSHSLDALLLATMTIIAIVSFLLATVAFVRFLTIKLEPRIARWRAVRHSGCQEPPSYPHKDPLGKDLYELSVEAYKQQRFLDLNEELFEKYGPTFKTISNGKIWIKTKDPRVSKAMYATFFEKFGMEPIRYEKNGFFGDGILVTDGARWKHSRGLIRPAFEMAHIANFDRLHRHVNRFLKILPKDGSTVDLLPLFKRLVSAVDLVRTFLVADTICHRPLTFPRNSSSANPWTRSLLLTYATSSFMLFKQLRKGLS